MESQTEILSISLSDACWHAESQECGYSCILPVSENADFGSHSKIHCTDHHVRNITHLGVCGVMQADLKWNNLLFNTTKLIITFLHFLNTVLRVRVRVRDQFYSSVITFNV